MRVFVTAVDEKRCLFFWYTCKNCCQLLHDPGIEPISYTLSPLLVTMGIKKRVRLHLGLMIIFLLKLSILQITENGFIISEESMICDIIS